ncbi:MAG: PAS domain-containing protein, partial [Rhodospirillales bacterium]|nr:PAS domain-containing protein [Rhodospirillales bacterium]
MTSLLSRLLLLIVLAWSLAFLLGQVVQTQTGPVLALSVGLAGMAATLAAAEWLVRRPLRRLLPRAERLAGSVPAGAARNVFARIGAALDAAATAQERLARAVREERAEAGAARAALAESEARQRLALAAADVTIYEIDLVQHRVWLDHRAAAITGGALPANGWFSNGDARLRSWFARLHPDDFATRHAAIRALILGHAETASITYRFRGADGAWRWLAERAAAVAHRPGSGEPLRIVGVVRDVTEQYDHAIALEHEVAERTAALRESER